MNTDDRYELWSRKYIRNLGDIWDEETREWHSTQTLTRFTGGRLVEQQRAKLLASIPWDLGRAQAYAAQDWWTTDIRGEIVEIFHIQRIEDGILQGDKYIVTPSEELTLVGSGPIHIGDKEVQRVKIVTRLRKDDKFKTFNPPGQTPETQSLWLAGSQPIQKLAIDPAEWNWEPQGDLSTTNILNYTTKRGYRLKCKRDAAPMKGERILRAHGFGDLECKQFYQDLWHP